MLNGSGLITGKMPSKNSKRLFLKHQYSITLVRVTKQGDKTMRPRMGLAFYWCSIVNQWHIEVGRSQWQRGSIHRPRNNFWRRSLAFPVSTNMGGFFAAEDDLLTAIHPRHTRQASSISANWCSNIIFTTRQSHSGNTSKAQSLSVTPDKIWSVTITHANYAIVKPDQETNIPVLF